MLPFRAAAFVLLTLIPVQNVVADTGWPDPVANHVVPYFTSGLTHGPMLGRPTATSVRVWVRTAKPTRFEIVYDRQLPLDGNSPTVTGETLADHDRTGTADLVELEPDTLYYYGVRIDGKLADIRLDHADPWPSFRTWPDTSSRPDPKHNPRGLFNICFAVGCCVSQDPVRSGGQYASPPAFDTLYRRHRHEVMFHLMNGDVIYEEARDGTVDGIRANYRLYWSRGRSFARLARYVPFLFSYDDHEIGWDIHGCGEVGLGHGKHLMRDPGLKPWTEYAAWANYAAPQRGAIRFGRGELKPSSHILHDPDADFSKLDLATVSTLHVGPFPDPRGGKAPKPPKNAGVYRVKRVVDPQRLQIEPPARFASTAAYSVGTHHYYDWKVGNCHFFALDTRGERSRPNLRNYRDPDRFMLGDVQRKWLLDGAANTDADFVFIVSPDPWVVYHTAMHVGGKNEPKGDGFASFVHEREKVIEALDRIAKPVVVFTGDVHNSFCIRITDNIYECAVGPMGSTAHPIGTAGNMPFGGWWESQGRKVQVRWCGNHPNNVRYERQRRTYYGVVQVNNLMKAGRPAGTGYQHVAFDAPQVVVRFHDGYTGKLMYAESISVLDAK